MARKYSMAHLGCLNWTPAEMIYNAKAIGYDYVSMAGPWLFAAAGAAALLFKV